MKIVGIMAIHKRPGITRETLKMLKERQTLPFHQIIVMGESPEEEACATETGCDFLKVQNDPLGRKYQAEVFWSMTYNPDALVVLGSDTWLSPGWLETGAREIEKGAELVGKADWYSLKAYAGETVEIIHRGYPEGHRRDPVGGGRMISRYVLDRMGWDLFPIIYNSNLDYSSFARMEEHDVRISILPPSDPVKVMGVKSTWPTLNKFDNLKVATRLKDLGDVPDPPGWLKKNFPGGTEALRRVVDNLRLEGNNE